MAAGQGMADDLRQATASLHAQAERTGIVADVLRGRASAAGYLFFLRNLHPVYRELERVLRASAADPRVAGLVEPAVFRAEAIASDLRRLVGCDWPARFALLPEARRYVRRVGSARGDLGSLLAHVYVRYLGDLNGGRVLDRLVSRMPTIGDRGLDFHQFAAIEDLDEFRRIFRAAIDRAGETLDRDGRAAVCAQAAEAFRANIAISAEIARRVSAETCV